VAAAPFAARGRIRSGLYGCESVPSVAVGTQHGITLEIGIDR
jgi:hypothetical protein